MEMLLGGIIVTVLGLFLLFEHRRYVRLKQNISYLSAKLEEIIEGNKTERVLLEVPEQELRECLVTVNRLLDFNHKNQIKYNKARISMKKMLSNVSHDLKTPLTVVLGYLELLELRYKEDETIHKTHTKVQEVIELINKFFDLAKLESGDKEIPMERLDLAEVCRMNILDYYNTLQSKGFEVDIQLPEEPIFVCANRNALNRILNNLISNALKYGDAGKYLGLYLVQDEERVTVQVKDKGKGIEEQHKEEVFERMYTLEDSRSKTYQGSGLGLTITKELVEVLGGEISLESVPYKQTIFSFTLNKLNY